MRTFIAIDLDRAIKKHLSDLQAQLGPRCPKLKWVDPNKMHLTIKFLGEVRDQQIAEISRALGRLAAECQPFDIAVEGLGTFNPTGPVKVVWIGIQDPSGRLAECQALCEDLIEPLGFPREGRRFSPHLTLARNKFTENSREIRAALDAQPPVRAGSQTVSGVMFYQSTLTPGGPIYSALSRHPLAT
ncbi:MAG: RNA 2',3'-cyclic phosphodiesterase [Phycisphaerae bacterium]|nr:RNA 2',3'-cyclic phosphodiesterase [Phycisphaerae bacterium]